MTPCREWQGSKNRDGYGVKWDRERKKNCLMHRWVVAQILGWDAIEGQAVMHLCHNRACFRYDHLQVGTWEENNRQMWQAERGVSNWKPMPGEANPMTTVPDDVVAEIRRRHAAGSSQKTLIEEFGVSRSQVSRIVRMETRTSCPA